MDEYHFLYWVHRNLIMKGLHFSNRLNRWNLKLSCSQVNQIYIVVRNFNRFCSSVDDWWFVKALWTVIFFPKLHFFKTFCQSLISHVLKISRWQSKWRSVILGKKQHDSPKSELSCWTNFNIPARRRNCFAEKMSTWQ